MSESLISVIIPCYNQAQYLPDAINSVIQQSYENWECILVNDGSTDGTAEVIDLYISKDTRIKCVDKINGGLASARNEGIKVAKGEFILPLDADDKIGKDYLLLAIEEFKKDSEIRVVYCDAELFGSSNMKWSLPEYSLQLLAQTNMIFCSALFRKKDWEEVGGYDPKMKYGLEDWEFWINILKSGGGQVYKLNYLGFYYRIKDDSMFKRMTEEQMRYSEDYVCKKHFDFITSVLGNPIYVTRKLNFFRRRIENLESTIIYKIYRFLSMKF